MKTPQEIAGLAKCAAYHACRHPGCGERNDALSTEIQSYGDDRAAAAREEGRREAFRSALDYHVEECAQCAGPDDGCANGQWLEIRALGKDWGSKERALASQPKPRLTDQERMDVDAATWAPQPKPEKDPSDGDFSGPFLAGMLLPKPPAVTSPRWSEINKPMTPQELEAVRASMPAAVACEGCKRGDTVSGGWHYRRDGHWTASTPCTAKPEDGKES